ncbi:SDR family oxidoreductase [Noviherbaspirillum sp. CPCC 100848]|uniref:SDR family oxidoreductase n=1 Tax=Noviherbaspirillum album TaxID=3080276 RepID=A0ABU6J6Y3_9BURK|nr:SDR family oxidoreductase [Noviherbaspirillum sp. CPCC 100848]MEC4719404.1 SDR family oxidoreductase [Noviherbaspirillum sp. CPCC 100848]
MAAQAELARFGSLKSKRVFITGGGSGIGESIVTGFAEQGAKVAFIDIAVDASLALCEKLAMAGYEKPVFRECDIRDIPALQEIMRTVAADIGDFDVLVNNAGNDQRHNPEEVTLEYWNDRIAINQRPMFFTCQAVIEGMKRRGGGAIINLGSTSWHIANGGYPVYTTTKAAVSGLTRGLARDLGPYNIRVNTVTPGWVMTERQLTMWVDEEGEKLIDQNQCLKGRVAPWHVARMVLFLASDDAAMCTAQEYIVDGGWA